jgi:hypothetical protein
MFRAGARHCAVPQHRKAGGQGPMRRKRRKSRGRFGSLLALLLLSFGVLAMVNARDIQRYVRMRHM